MAANTDWRWILNELLQSTTREEEFVSLFEHLLLPTNERFRQKIVSYIQRMPGPFTDLKPFGWYSEDLVPDIPDCWLEKARRSFMDPTASITYIEMPSLAHDSLAMLRPENKINDEIVEGYLKLISPQFLIGTTKFLSLLLTGTTLGPIDSRINRQSLMTFGQIFIPIFNSRSRHWTFVRIVQEIYGIQIQHYDSLTGSDLPDLTMLPICFPGKDVKTVQSYSPQQQNDFDCGVYMLMSIRLLTSGSDLPTPDQARKFMPSSRARILTELLAGKMDPNVSDYEDFSSKDMIAANLAPLPLGGIIYGGSGNDSSPWVLDTPGSISGNDVSLPPASANFEGSMNIDDSELYPSSDGSPSDHSIMGTSGSEISTSSIASSPSPGRGFEDSMDIDGPRPTSSSDASSPSPGHPLASVFKQDPRMTLLSTPVPTPLCTSKVSGVKQSPPRAGQKGKRKVGDLVSSFGDQAAILTVLHVATTVARSKMEAARTTARGESLLSLWDRSISDESFQRTLGYRYARKKFSEALFAEEDRLKSGGIRKPFAIRAQLQTLLGSIEYQMVPAMQTQATRSKIWTSLTNLLRQHLESGFHVALCASPESTSSIETLDKRESAKYVVGIEARLKDEKDPLLLTLKYAAPLVDAILNRALPLHDIAIEKKLQWDSMSFEETVSLDRMQQKMVLPRRRLASANHGW